MNIKAYFNRINYKKNNIETNNLSLVTKLQTKHVFTIPFENLDIIEGRKIKLDISSIYDKVIIRKRGGICYELNGLFNELLLSLDFKSHLVSADIYGSDEKETHACILLNISGERYIIDVGYGDISRQPIPLDGTAVNDISGTYYIKRITEKFFDVVKITPKNDIKTLYRFNISEKKITDFNEVLKYNTYSPDSVFNKNQLMTIATSDGRATLVSNKLVITKNRDKITEVDFVSKEIKQKYFNMDVV